MYRLFQPYNIHDDNLYAPKRGKQQWHFSRIEILDTICIKLSVYTKFTSIMYQLLSAIHHSILINKEYLAKIFLQLAKPGCIFLSFIGTGCNGSWRCCRSYNKCQVGEGHCQSNSDCYGNLYCGILNCPGTYWSSFLLYNCCTGMKFS